MSKAIKKQIYFARTYRHLKVNRKESCLYLLLFVLPMLLTVLFLYSNLTRWMTDLTWSVLDYFQLIGHIERSSAEFMPIFGEVYFLEIPTVYPSWPFVLGNIAFILLVFWLCSSGRRKKKPLSIYIIIALFVHLISCVFFLFAASYFPYTAGEYSELYIKQQVGIWISFIVISGLLTGLLGSGHILYRIFTMFGIMLYSYVFATLRYIVFLVIAYRFSVLYLASMYFTFGVFYDYMYFVFIYGCYLNKVANRNDSEKGRVNWKWV